MTFTENNLLFLALTQKQHNHVYQTLTVLAEARIFPQETASSGRAPESLPSNSGAVLIKTAKSAPLGITFALQI